MFEKFGLNLIVDKYKDDIARAIHDHLPPGVQATASEKEIEEVVENGLKTLMAAIACGLPNE